jgi:hypothetical protein
MLYAFLISPMRDTCCAHPVLRDYADMWRREQIMKSLVMQCD